MYSTNIVVITGRLVKDPEVTVTPGKKNLSKFSVAINEGYTDKESKSWVDQKAFINCVSWNGVAKKSEKLQKGDEVLVEGKLRQDFYKKDGEDKSTQLYLLVSSIKKANSNGNSKPETAEEADVDAEDLVM